MSFSASSTVPKKHTIENIPISIVSNVLEKNQFSNFDIPVNSINISNIIQKYSNLYDVNSELALNIACAESCTRNKDGDVIFNINAKNPTSTASGIFQFIQSTFDSMCDGEVFDPDDNIRCAIKILSTKNGIRHWDASRTSGFGNGWANRPYEKFNIVN